LIAYIRTRLDMKDPERLREFLGCSYARLSLPSARGMAVGQESYTEHLVAKFEQENGGPVKVVDTPSVSVDSSLDLAGPGQFHATCRTHIGALSHLVRHTRPDGEQAVFFLQREVTRWSMGSDARLRRVMGYFKNTITFGLVWRAVDTVEIAALLLREYSDSDHGGCPSSGRSTSGWCVFWCSSDETTRILVDYGCRRQSAASHSTTESEVGAVNDSLTRSGYPLLSLTEEFFGALDGTGEDDEGEEEDARRPEVRENEIVHELEDGIPKEDSVTLEQLVDNDACRTILDSAKESLPYLRKHARVDICTLRDSFRPDSRRFGRIGTKDNPSDIFTKNLKDSKAFLKHRETLGVIDLRSVEKYKIVEQPLQLPDVTERSLGRRLAGQAANAAIYAGEVGLRAAGMAMADPETRSVAFRWALRRAGAP
jgi:hypothetical protein